MIDRAPGFSTTMAMTGTHGPEYQRGVVAFAEWEHLPRRHTENVARFVSVLPIASRPCRQSVVHTDRLAVTVVRVYRGRLRTTGWREREQNRHGSTAKEER